MGKEEWTRHVIINTQPADKTAEQSAEYLWQKPTIKQGQQRVLFNIDQRFQLESQETDKVYVVGHGDEEKQKLGGEQPEALAEILTAGVHRSQQVNLVMCGASDVPLARRFAKRLYRRGYQGTVYAYRG